MYKTVLTVKNAQKIYGNNMKNDEKTKNHWRMYKAVLDYS